MAFLIKEISEKSLPKKENKPLMRKAKNLFKLSIEIKSTFGNDTNFSKTLINTNYLFKEKFQKIYTKKNDRNLR